METPIPPEEESSEGSSDAALDELVRRVARSPNVDIRQALPEGFPAGEYHIIEAIGRGSFGTVYRAVQPVIGKEVAIKVLDTQAANSKYEQRFVAEARAVNRIKHRNIVDIFGFGALPNGQKFYVMELLSGETLAALLTRRGAVSPLDALSILEQLASALDAAHQVGILHRDLKPGNVFLNRTVDAEEAVKLLDFGIAKFLETSEPGMTQANFTLGTPAYMSPEQCAGTSLSASSDIYSLGVIAYEMLTGRRPFAAASLRELFEMHSSMAPPPASDFNPSLSANVDGILCAMLSKAPHERPATAQGAVKALREALYISSNAAYDRGRRGSFQDTLTRVDGAGRTVSPPSGPVDDVATSRGMAAFDTVADGAKTQIDSALHGVELSVTDEATPEQSRLQGREPNRARVPSPSAKGPLLLRKRYAFVSFAAITVVGVSVARSRHDEGPLTARQPPAALVAPGSSHRHELTPGPAPSAATASSPTQEAERVRVWIRGAPARAKIYRGRELVGDAGAALSFSRGTTPLDLRIEAPGYSPRIVRLIPDRDQAAQVGLSPRSRPRTNNVSRGDMATDELAF